MKEKWKKIKEFADGLYSVSSLGQVRNNKTGKYIVGDINNFGYYRVTLYYNGTHKRFMRHRLVAKYFLKKRNKDKKFVNHIDGNKENNTIYNLEWVTQSENEKHAFKNKLKKRTNKKLLVEFANEISLVFNNQKELANELGCHQSQISLWVLNKKEIPKKYNISKLEFIS